MNNAFNRRQFLQRTTLSAGGFWLLRHPASVVKATANDKLNVAFVGTTHRAGEDLSEVASQTASVNVVALCDVDDNYLAAAAQKHPGAKTYNDFRRMLERKDIDAVVVGTPDHTHAVAAAAALKSGRHVYCEKPLTRTVSEARIVTELAKQHNRVTQIGTQIHAGANYRRVVELIQTRAVGLVREVHVWVGVSYGGKDRPKDKPPVPPALHWDLWLGPVEYLDYHPEYAPFNWRHWWAFGGGALADFGCHYMDLPHWALELCYPLSVEVVDGPPVHPDSTPPWLIVRYQYPERKKAGTGESLPPVTLTWYHGGKQPPYLDDEQKQHFGSGVLFIGEKGRLLADYGRYQLLPEKDFADFKPPAKFIPDSIGHHKEWVEACKTGAATTCAFDYSGPLTEAALLGNVAYRAGSKLEWDAKKLRATNCQAADQFIQHRYRKGWTL
jgi:predicted dehydrogenase